MAKDPSPSELAAVAWQQMTSCDLFKAPRLSRVTEMEQAYHAAKFQPNIMGRSNIPLPYFAYYIDELKARLDEPPIAKFHAKQDAKLLVARKVQSAAEIDRSPARGDWNRNDRMEKTMAIFTGIGVHDYYADAMEPSEDGKMKYGSHYEPVDLADFYFEPTGGSDLEQHAFVGKGNIFRDKAYIEEMAELGIYDKAQVDKLFMRGRGEEYKAMRTAYITRWSKYASMGLNLAQNNFIGGEWFPLAAWQMTYGLKRWYLTFDMVTGEWVRCQPLREVFKGGLYSMTMWQTHEDPHNVLSKSPADDFWPIAEFLRSQANYLIDAATKHLWGQRIIDPNFVPDPSQLYWQRPDQIIEGVSFNGKPLGNGVFEFTTEDKTTTTLPVLQYFETLLAKVAGVTPDNAGGNEAERVGVLFGNLQKVSARLGVLNKSYNEAFYRTMVRYVWGLKQYLDEPMMVKLIGENGVEWDELKASELTGPEDFDIECVGSNIELEMSEARKTRQTKTITDIMNNPILAKELNPRVTVEELLRASEFKDESARRMTDVSNYGSEESISHAAIAIEQLLRGKTPKLYDGADINFFKYGFKFITSNDLKHEDYVKIFNYFQAHYQHPTWKGPDGKPVSIIVRNMTAKALGNMTGDALKAMVAPPQPPQAPGAPAGAPPTIAPLPPGGPVPSNPAQVPPTPSPVAGAAPVAQPAPPMR